MRQVNDYIPKKEPRVLVQAKISESLHKRVKHILDKEVWTWHEFIQGLFQKYVDEQSNATDQIKKPRSPK